MSAEGEGKWWKEYAMAYYTRTDGHREWWSGGTWLRPGDVVLEINERDLQALRASLSQEEWEILLHALDCIDEGHEALRAKVRELASAPGPGPVEMAKSVTSRSVKAAEAADEMVRLFLSEAEKCPLLPIEGHVQWTDWITMVLKNCGAWETSRDRAP